MDASLAGGDAALSALSPAGLARAARALALRLPLLYLALFFFYPLLAISAVSFLRDGQLDLAALARILTRPYYRERLLFTLGQAALSTLLTLALALPARTGAGDLSLPWQRRAAGPGHTALRAADGRGGRRLQSAAGRRRVTQPRANGWAESITATTRA